MKLLLLFITIIFCIIQNVIAIYNKDIFLPKCNSLYIEEAYIGPNKEEHVRRCRYRPDRNRIYCDLVSDTTLVACLFLSYNCIFFFNSITHITIWFC